MISRRGFLTHNAASLALLPLAAPRQNSDQIASEPWLVPPDDIAAAIDTIPKSVRFGFSGLAYFEDRLCASCNLGLLEFRDRKLYGLHQWKKRDRVVVGPWNDSAHKCLWLQHARPGTLTRLDATGWSNVVLPVPKGGYTRGDMLEGFRGVSGPNGFWLVGGGHVWRWDSKNNQWDAEPEPPAPRFSGTIAVAWLPEGLLHVVREGVSVFPPSNFAAYRRLEAS